RRARRGGALQTRRHGFRAVETVEAGRAGVAVAGGNRVTGTTRLAHRVLGDGVEASGRDLRHSRRGPRSRVSPPRERDRAIALRVPYAGDGEYLDAQRISPTRRREDGEEPGEFRDDQGAARGLAGRGAALQYAAHALPSAHRLDDQGARGE